MKNFKHIFGVLISLFFAGNTWAWTVEDFHSDIQIQTDGSAIITETIVADFTGELHKHGIFRYIPYRSKTDNHKINSTPITLKSITDENENPRNYYESTENNNILWKIGDPDKTVNPQEIYVLKYRVERVPKKFPENNFAEFYWNVTGNAWEVEIKKASVQISLPQNSEIQKMQCFTGAYQSTEQNCHFEKIDQKSATFSTENLKVDEGLTIVYGFDPELVPTFSLQEITWLESEWWEEMILKIRLTSLIIPLIFGVLGWRKKQKILLKKPIIPKYEPPAGLHPTMVGSVIDGKFDKRDFVAGFIDLAVKGFIKIEKKEVSGLLWNSDEYFIKNTEKFANKQLEPPFSATFYDYLFRTNTIKRKEDEREGFFPHRHPEEMFLIYEKVLTKVANENYFNSTFGNAMSLLGWLSLFFIAGLSIFGNWLLAILGLILMSALCYLVFYPRRTAEGFKIAHEAKCYREFLETAEVDQLNWAEKQEIFEKNLPYAVAFGLTKKWTKVFGDLIQTPEWLPSGSIHNLSNDLSRITNDISSNIYDPNASSGSSGFSSSGGGFSGGGSGGGGGGSW